MYYYMDIGVVQEDIDNVQALDKTFKKERAQSEFTIL